MVPNGMSVIVNSPSVFRHTLADRLAELMQPTHMPNGLVGIGYTRSGVRALVEGSLPQGRLLDNALTDVDFQAFPAKSERTFGFGSAGQSSAGVRQRTVVHPI